MVFSSLHSADHTQRQLDFLDEAFLRQSPQVRQLVRPLAPVRERDPCLAVLARFLRNPELYALPVVDAANRPLALLDRRQFVEFFSQPFSREVFGRRGIGDLLIYPDYRHDRPVIVEESCHVEDVAEIIIDAGMQHMASGFLVASNGLYLGVANGHDLLRIITQRKQAELYYHAHYDGLTGIPNRMLFADRLKQACREADRNKGRFGLLFVDIDRFKQINDTLGHSAGDIVLRKITERIQASARNIDTVARLSGDEFVILMEEIADRADVAVVAERLIEAMRAPIELLGHALVVTASVGSAIYPDDDGDIGALLAKADAAMYQVKSLGRDGYRTYEPGAAMHKPSSMILENELRQAIQRDELELHFQPQFRLEADELCGVEALVRWRRADGSLAAPGLFIPIAEESGLIVALGDWVLKRAMHQIRCWEELGLPPLRVSVNISALQFHRPGFLEKLKTLLAEEGLNPRRLEIELTESVLMQNVDEVMQTLAEIKALGISLSIDDFGTGYSSLGYLRRFPIDRLKIDQSFVRDIDRLPINESIACAIVALARSLTLEVVAEGLETPAERAVLEQMRCDEAQGYLFARPMSADDFVAWLIARSVQPSPGAPCANRSLFDRDPTTADAD